MPNFEFFLADSLEKVFADTRPRPLDRKKISGFKGERVSFQIVYYLEDPAAKHHMQHFNVTVSGSPVPARIRSVELVPSQYPCTSVRDKNYLRTDPGLFPDLLMPSDGKILPIDDQYRSLWVDLMLEDCPSGAYTISCKAEAEEITDFGNGTFRTTGREFDWEETLELNVIPARLPEQTLIHTEWFHTDCLANYYNTDVFSDEYWRIVENFVSTAKRDCGINTLLTPVFTPPLDTEVGGERTTVQLVGIRREKGRYSFDFKWLKRWCGICRKHGITHLEIAHFFTQWGAYATPKILADADGTLQRIFGWDIKATSPEYRHFLEHFIPALTSFLEDEGYDREHLFFHVSDEPRKEHLESYKAAKSQLADLLEGYTIMDALSDYEFYKKGLVAHPVPANDHITDFIDNRVPDLWVYYCVAQGVDVPNRFFSQPSARNRIMGVLMYLYDIKGFLHWGFNFYNTSYSRKAINPFVTTDSGMAFPSGDPFLVYPAPDGSAYSSIRNEVQMEAFQDLRTLQLLESKIGRDEVVKLILEGAEELFTFASYPRSSQYFTRLRERINAKAEKLFS